MWYNQKTVNGDARGSKNSQWIKSQSIGILRENGIKRKNVHEKILTKKRTTNIMETERDQTEPKRGAGGNGVQVRRSSAEDAEELAGLGAPPPGPPPRRRRTNGKGKRRAEPRHAVRSLRSEDVGKHPDEARKAKRAPWRHPAARASLPDPNVLSLSSRWKEGRRRRSCAPLPPADRLQNAGKRERRGIENRQIFNARGDICRYAPGI